MVPDWGCGVVEHSPDSFHMQTVSRGRSKCPCCGLKIVISVIELYSVFFRRDIDCFECEWKCKSTTRLLGASWVDFSESPKAIMKDIQCRNGEPVQISQKRDMWSLLLAQETSRASAYAEDLLQLPTIFGPDVPWKRSYSSLDGSRPSNVHHASRLIVDTSTYMTQGSGVRGNEPLHIPYPRDCWKRACRRDSFKTLRYFLVRGVIWGAGGPSPPQGKRKKKKRKKKKKKRKKKKKKKERRELWITSNYYI